MRAIVATAIFLVGINSAEPKTQYQDSLAAAGGGMSPSASALAAPLGKSNRNVIVAIPPLAPSESAHDHDEGAREVPQPPAPVISHEDADAKTADSLDSLCSALLASAQDNGLPIAFFANLIWQESRLQRDAISRVGALGIAQFMPRTAAEAGLLDPFDPRQAIPASARLLHTLREHFGNLGFAAAAYNAGARRVGEWLDRGHALPSETRNYVLRVTGHSLEAWRKAPVDDAALTFVPPLPCRQLPAFADLEPAQWRAAQQFEEAHRIQPQRPNAAAKLVAKRVEAGAHKDAVKRGPASHAWITAPEFAANGIVARGRREAALRPYPSHARNAE